MALQAHPLHSHDPFKDQLRNYLTQALWVNPDPALTIPRVFQRIVTQYGDEVALLEKQKGAYQPRRYDEVMQEAHAVAAALLARGLQSQGRVALLLKNSAIWPLVDLGTLFAGASTVPIYPTLAADAIRYILEDSSTEVLFLENASQYQKVAPFLEALPKLKYCVIRRPDPVSLSDKVLSFENFLEIGHQYLASETDQINHRMSQLTRDDVASIVYTSGTTGVPKGVMLTHLNFLSTVYGLIAVTDCNHYDRFLSILPLSHVFERSFGYYLPLLSGASIAYAEGIESIAKNFREAQPTICAAVPRIFEKLYTKVNGELAKGSLLKRRLFWWATRVGRDTWALWQENLRTQELSRDHRRHHRAEDQLAQSFRLARHPLLCIKYGLARWLVYKKLRNRFGGKIRYFVTGGAPLNKDIINYFRNLQIIIYEGYGLTETSPIISFNYGNSFKAGTVGKLPTHVNIKLSEQGEILVKGPNVMQGYLNKLQETHDVIDDEGWFHTGDVGEFDDEQFLKITDRIKELIVLSTGKNVPPLPLEQKLTESKLVSYAAILGNNRKYISALIFPDVEHLEAEARRVGMTGNGLETWCQHPEIKKLYASLVTLANQSFSGYEQIRRFELVPYDLTDDTELLTPTLKLKRKRVEEKFGDWVAKLYR